jgi:serine phosphatase RsbU (regulator of sigma subunit)
LWIVTKREGQIIDGIVPYTCEQENETKYYLHEIKPDKQPIGKYAETSPFHNHVIHLEPGDTFYVFTDGYADQFGGPRGKKYKYKPFKNLILGLQEKKMDAQHHELDWQFEKWRGELEQVDDVCIIGVRI